MNNKLKKHAVIKSTNEFNLEKQYSEQKESNYTWVNVHIPRDDFILRRTLLEARSESGHTQPLSENEIVINYVPTCSCIWCREIREQFDTHGYGLEPGTCVRRIGIGIWEVVE